MNGDGFLKAYAFKNHSFKTLDENNWPSNEEMK